MIVQHELLDRVAGLVDEGVVRTTLTQELSPFNAERCAARTRCWRRGG